jgi:hypothetical protein
MTSGYAPSAHKVVCVDFDSTIYPWAPIMAKPDPLPGAVEAVRRLKEAGYRIVIFTSRLSPTWLNEEGYTSGGQRDHIRRLLERDGIPFDAITAEKLPAQWYIDDRAVRFREGEWPGIVDWILFSQEQQP